MKTMHWMPGFKLTNKCKRIIYILCPNDYVSCTLHAAMLDFQALRKRSTKMNGMWTLLTKIVIHWYLKLQSNFITLMVYLHWIQKNIPQRITQKGYEYESFKFK